MCMPQQACRGVCFPTKGLLASGRAWPRTIVIVIIVVRIMICVAIVSWFLVRKDQLTIVVCWCRWRGVDFPHPDPIPLSNGVPYHLNDQDKLWCAKANVIWLLGCRDGWLTRESYMCQNPSKQHGKTLHIWFSSGSHTPTWLRANSGLWDLFIQWPPLWKLRTATS